MVIRLVRCSLTGGSVRDPLLFSEEGVPEKGQLRHGLLDGDKGNDAPEITNGHNEKSHRFCGKRGVMLRTKRKGKSS